MREIITNIELGGEVLVDIDVLTDDSYLAITDKGSVVFPSDKIVMAQTFKFPIIRQLNENSFLVADSRTASDRADNCFIYDLKGHVIKHFYAGDGIEDIEVLRNKIVITYFDEGVYGPEGPMGL